MLSVRACMALNFGMTMAIMMTMAASRITTAIPVASVHSKPSPAILHTAHTAMIGDLTMSCRPMVMNICTCVMSLVERVMRLAVENLLLSAGPKDSTLRNSSERRRWVNEAATRAAM